MTFELISLLCLVSHLDALEFLHLITTTHYCVPNSPTLHTCWLDLLFNREIDLGHVALGIDGVQLLDNTTGTS